MIYLFKKQLFLLPLLCAMASQAQFKGGNGDGTAQSAVAAQRIGQNIFLGGNNDGHALAAATLQPLGNNIFLGGINDGSSFSMATAQPLGLNIFLGGANDGHAVASIAAQPLGMNIFLGGANDGWHMAAAASQNIGGNIFLGGSNDGWAMSFAAASDLQAALPVTLTDFSGQWQSNDVLLRWQTSLEINTANFVVQRGFSSSTFNDIGSLPAAGQSQLTLQYKFTDAGVKSLLPPGTSNVYYRLKTVDQDGSISYSAVIVLRTDRGALSTYSIYPNPASNAITITVSNLPAGNNTFIRFYNVSGHLVLQQRLVNTRQQVAVTGMANGTYFMQLHSNNSILYTQKVIIQK